VRTTLPVNVVVGFEPRKAPPTNNRGGFGGRGRPGSSSAPRRFGSNANGGARSGSGSYSHGEGRGAPGGRPNGGSRDGYQGRRGDSARGGARRSS